MSGRKETKGARYNAGVESGRRVDTWVYNSEKTD